jgi:hypothetical protein
MAILEGKLCTTHCILVILRMILKLSPIKHFFVIQHNFFFDIYFYCPCIRRLTIGYFFTMCAPLRPHPHSVPVPCIMYTGCVYRVEVPTIEIN